MATDPIFVTTGGETDVSLLDILVLYALFLFVLAIAVFAAVVVAARPGLVIHRRVDMGVGHLKLSQPASGTKRSPNFCARMRRATPSASLAPR